MALRVEWSPEAVEDIESIASYIERDSEWYAKAVVSRFIELAEAAAQFPDAGRAVPEPGDTAIRERFAYSYRLIYRVEPDRILIVAVIHGSRMLDPHATRIKGTR